MRDALLEPEAAIPAEGAHCVFFVFIVSRCGTPAHDKWICTDSGESSPASGDSPGQQFVGMCWSDQEGSGSFPGSHLCQVSLDAQVPKAHLAQLYCCCLVLITPHHSFNLEVEQGQFQPHLIPGRERGGGNVPVLAGGDHAVPGVGMWESRELPCVCRVPSAGPLQVSSHPWSIPALLYLGICCV